MTDSPPDPPAPDSSAPNSSAPEASPADPPGARSRLHTEALARRGRWPGLVWAIPLAALLVVIYLGIQGVAHHGVNVVVTFKTAGGARAGQTPVIYKGVTVGHVVKIEIAANARDVDMTLRLENRARTHLREGAMFWLIGAKPSLTDLSSLEAAVSGVSIGVWPGTGAPQRHFIGMEQPPAIPPGTAGTLYVLDGDQIGSTREGSGVYYHGLQVGRVTRVDVAGPQSMRLGIFVNAPYDRLVHAGTLFFNAAAADVALSAGQLHASLGPGTTILTGGIEFDTPPNIANTPQAPKNTLFHFYVTEMRASDQPQGPQVRYRAIFRGATQLPQPDAPVFLSGARIGRVLDGHVRLPRGATAPVTEVTLELEPQKLAIPLGSDARADTDAALRDLVRGGYRLQMGQFPPLVGTATLIFVHSATAKPARFAGGDAAEIPTDQAAGVEELTGQMNQILAKVNAIPITAIGRDVRQITGRVSQLVSSPQIDDSLRKLDSTLTTVDQMTREVKPQVGPLIAKLNQTADQLQGLAANANAVMGGAGGGQDATLPDALKQVTNAARSIRDLADYLGRHPEAVLKGKSGP